MTPRAWHAMATLVVVALVPFVGVAQTQVGLVSNWDCEQATSVDPLEDPLASTDNLFSIPGWRDYDASPPPLVDAAPAVGRSARIDGMGADQTAGCIVVGPGALVSLPFAVTGGSVVSGFAGDVWVIRDVASCAARECPSGTELVVEYFTISAGRYERLGSSSISCDDVADAQDNGILDGSDDCSASDGHVHVQAKDDSPSFECLNAITSAGVVVNTACTKYDALICNAADAGKRDPDCVGSSNFGGCRCRPVVENDLFMPAAATGARVYLSGAPSPTTIISFDNIVFQ